MTHRERERQLDHDPVGWQADRRCVMMCVLRVQRWLRSSDKHHAPLFEELPQKPSNGDDGIPSLCLSATYYPCVGVFAGSPPSSSSSDLHHHLLRHPSSPPCGASASATQPLRLMRHRLRITFQPHISPQPCPQPPPTPQHPHPILISCLRSWPGLA